MTKPFEVSPRLEARLAGVLYLISIVFGVAAIILIRRKMLVRGDQATVVAGVLYSGMTLLLSHLLWPVNKWISGGCRNRQPGGLLASAVVMVQLSAY